VVAHNAVSRGRRDSRMISIVMPTLDEAANLAARAAELAGQPGDWEWIVSDGGSTDGTVACARRLGARVLETARSRGGQLNAGAAVATGTTILFLHADTALPPGALDAIRRATARGVRAGCFRLRFDGRTLAERTFAGWYAAQQRLLRVTFGDSAIWVDRRLFERLGGYPALPVMEDYAFTRELARGTRMVTLPLAVTTSARRFRRRPLRAIGIWALMLALYHLGVPPSRLARIYHPEKRVTRP